MYDCGDFLRNRTDDGNEFSALFRDGGAPNNYLLQRLGTGVLL